MASDHVYCLLRVAPVMINCLEEVNDGLNSSRTRISSCLICFTYKGWNLYAYSDASRLPCKSLVLSVCGPRKRDVFAFARKSSATPHTHCD